MQGQFRRLIISMIVWCILVITVGSLRTLSMLGDRSKSPGEYLERMVERKRVEVDNLLRRHNSIDDPLVMRMTYVNSNSKYEIAKALRKPDFGPEELGKMSVIVDVKRKSPTVTERRDVVDFTNAGEFCQLLSKIGINGLFINTEMEYGGKFPELKECHDALKCMGHDNIPPLIHKDLIIHPIQVRHPSTRFSGRRLGTLHIMLYTDC